jgi:ribosomal protein S18 acetylase RimI-like enzyme
VLGAVTVRIEPRRALSPSDLDAIAGLEAQCLAIDGGRLKLEWGRLRSRPGTVADDVLAWDDDELAGFVGIYVFGDVPELTGMVAPRHRGAGLGGRLLDEALAECARRGVARVLLVVPRPSEPGRRLALARGGRLEHSEHTLELAAPPSIPVGGPAVSLRPAIADDTATVCRLLAEGFGQEVAEDDRRWRVTTMVVVDGSAVGALRLSREGDAAGVHGFVVQEALRGRGIGRRALALACRQGFDEGATSVFLEVETRNEHALGLYTSLGFVRTSTEDYYEVVPR